MRNLVPEVIYLNAKHRYLHSVFNFWIDDTCNCYIMNLQMAWQKVGKKNREKLATLKWRLSGNPEFSFGTKRSSFLSCPLLARYMKLSIDHSLEVDLKKVRAHEVD